MDKKEKKFEANPEQLTFKIADFEGPLDLLLHLIKKNEMDIYDIQMTEITSQYIDYLHRMKKMELNIAGEYFVTAAMLLNIKSRMLLPNEPTEEQTDESSDDFNEDPRDRLVQQLLTHQIYQQAAGQLQDKFAERSQHFEREQGLVPTDAKLGKLSNRPANIKNLERAFKKILARQQKNAPLYRSVTSDRYSIKQEMKRLDVRVQNAGKPLIFDELFTTEYNVELYVTTFLALLELVKLRKIQMLQTDNFGQIKMISGDVNAFKSS